MHFRLSRDNPRLSKGVESGQELLKTVAFLRRIWYNIFIKEAVIGLMPDHGFFAFISLNKEVSELKTGGYTMALYLIDWLGPSSEVIGWLVESVGRSLQYDDRKTALEWCGQILAALRDYTGGIDSPPEDALAAVRKISRSLARYVDRLDHGYKECEQWT